MPNGEHEKRRLAAEGLVRLLKARPGLTTREIAGELGDTSRPMRRALNQILYGEPELFERRLVHEDYAPVWFADDLIWRQLR